MYLFTSRSKFFWGEEPVTIFYSVIDLLLINCNYFVIIDISFHFIMLLRILFKI